MIRFSKTYIIIFRGDGKVEDAPSVLTDEDVDDLGNVLAGFTKDDFTKMDDVSHDWSVD